MNILPVIFTPQGTFSKDITNGIPNWRFSGGIKLTNGELYFSPQNLDSDRVPFDYKSKDVLFEYGKNSDSIYIRGNGNDKYFGHVDGKYTGTDLYQDSEDRQPIEIYVAYNTEDSDNGGTAQKVVIYYDAEGNAHDLAIVNDKITLGTLPDVTAPNEDGVDTLYTFLGWSTDKTFKGNPYLSLEDSCNLFAYNPKYDFGTIKGYDGSILDSLDNLKEKYSLVGHCNPEKVNTVSIDELLKTRSVETVANLYPVYAVRGFMTAVVAYNENEPVLTIGGDRYLDDTDIDAIRTNAKWLGSIDIEVYVDGKEAATSGKMYFEYHADDTIDTRIKFFPTGRGYNEQDLSGNGELYQFITVDDDYPKDSTGYYTIDGVYAIQAGSQDDNDGNDSSGSTKGSTGLNYKLNWITADGGLLDNVAGTETLKVYVTTKYNFAYYLDDKLIETGDWFKPGDIYATSETENLFNGDTKGAQLAIDSKSKPELKGLMDPNVEKVNNSSHYRAEDIIENGIARGVRYRISYFLSEYPHRLTLAATPESLVPDGRRLVSKSWTLKDKDLNEIAALDYSSSFKVTGNEGSAEESNKQYAYKAASSSRTEPKTFHCYAYTDVPDLTTSIEIHKEQSVNDGARTRERLSTVNGDIVTYYLTVSNTGATPAINAVVRDEIPEGLTLVDSSISNGGVAKNGVITWQLGDIAVGESKTVSFKVSVPPVTQYTSWKNFGTVSYDNPLGSNTTGSGSTTGGARVPGSHDNPLASEVVELVEEPINVPMTGDNSHPVLWMALMILSLLGMATALRQMRERKA